MLWVQRYLCSLHLSNIKPNTAKSCICATVIILCLGLRLISGRRPHPKQNFVSLIIMCSYLISIPFKDFTVSIWVSGPHLKFYSSLIGHWNFDDSIYFALKLWHWEQTRKIKDTWSSSDMECVKPSTMH